MAKSRHGESVNLSRNMLNDLEVGNLIIRDFFYALSELEDWGYLLDDMGKETRSEQFNKWADLINTILTSMSSRDLDELEQIRAQAEQYGE